MTDGVIGEIRLFAGNFVWPGWAKCDGQRLRVKDHPALYSVLGTAYGGDGREAFALPDLSGNGAPGSPSYLICVDGVFPQRS